MVSERTRGLYPDSVELLYMTSSHYGSYLGLASGFNIFLGPELSDRPSEFIAISEYHHSPHIYRVHVILYDILWPSVVFLCGYFFDQVYLISGYLEPLGYIES